MFTPVSAERISSGIVHQIKSAILSGRVEKGDRLPPERDLAMQFGVSRVTVRDALRILEAEGLIQIRVGARGGAVVTAPETSRVGEGIANMLLMSSISPDDVAEARLLIELGTVRIVRTDSRSSRPGCDMLMQPSPSGGNSGPSVPSRMGGLQSALAVTSRDRTSAPPGADRPGAREPTGGGSSSPPAAASPLHDRLGGHTSSALHRHFVTTETFVPVSRPTRDVTRGPAARGRSRSAPSRTSSRIVRGESWVTTMLH